MTSLKGQSIGGLLDPQLTNLTLNQRRTMQNLVGQGIAPNVARNLAIALTKSAAVPVAKKSYHQAFSEAAKEILPDGLTSRLHLRARAIAGGYAKKAKRMSEEEVVDAVKAEGMTPPKGVQAACKRGLELAPEHGGDGLTEGAKARARAMAAGSPVSPEQLRRMASFFARHSSYEKETSPPSPGYVSWLLWGGDAGRSWADSKKDSVQKAEFNESDHPRDEKGQFAEGGGGGSAPSLKEQSDAHYAEAQKRKAAGDRQGYLESMRAGNAALNAHTKQIQQNVRELRAQNAQARKDNAAALAAARNPAKADAEPVAQNSADAAEDGAKTAAEHVANADAHTERQAQSMANAKAALAANDLKGAREHLDSAARHGAAALSAKSKAIDAKKLEVAQAKRDARTKQARIRREERRQDRAAVTTASDVLRMVKKSKKPMGAAFAHARASGKKQDHKSRKRRANAYLRSQGHEPIGKMAPNAADVRAEQFLKLVRDRKKKSKRTIEKADWQEDMHPRANNGQFGESGASAEPSKYGQQLTDQAQLNSLNSYVAGSNLGSDQLESMPGTKSASEALSAAIQSSVLPSDKTFYRGAKIPIGTKVGDIVGGPNGFTSTSSSEEIANHFASLASDFVTVRGDPDGKMEYPHSHLEAAFMTIKAPAGTPVLDVERATRDASYHSKTEKEFIFDKTTAFRVVADSGMVGTKGNGGYRKITLEPIAVAQAKKAVSVNLRSQIIKAEQQDWQRLVWSVVYEPDSIDLHGDFMDADTIQKAAHDAMRSGIYINSEHRGDPLDAEVVESYTAPCDFTLSTSDGDVTVTKGSWVQCLHVKDDAHWAGVLDGTYTGFSLEGMALAHPLD